MHTDPAHGEVKHHKNRHLAEKTESMLGLIMLIAIVVLAVGLVWGLMQTGNTSPDWMR